MKAALLIPLGMMAMSGAAHAADDDAAPASVSEVLVTAPSSISNLTNLPTTRESVTADVLAKTISVVTPEDTLRYLPNILVRQRHIGDTQAPVATRTSGLGASARSLIYVDGMLISSLIGNNNTSASPKWGLVSPGAVERVDVLYGPFAAAYAGNSIGAVIAFTTRMPKAFEGSAQVQAVSQSFSRYGEDKRYASGRFAADIGDRRGPLAFRLSYNHLDSHGQPLTYVTATALPSASPPGIAVTGAFGGANRNGAPIMVLGSAGIEHQVQDNVSGRLTYDLTPAVTAAYTFGLFRNDDASTASSYLRDASGQSVYAAPITIAGRPYSIAASAFPNGVYRLDELQLAQGLSVASHTGDDFDFELTGTAYDYLKSRQRTPTGPLPGGFGGGAGTTASLNGTGWYTLDANGTWRPGGGAQVLTFGVHQDDFKLSNPRYALTDWLGGGDGAVLTRSSGHTRTQALWLQDAWSLTPQLKATIGGRYERWRAYDGVNFSAAPALDVRQPGLSRDAFSPKAVLAWSPSPAWTFKGSVGLAYRFPTVTELYQAITTGPQLQVPDPDLKPERALSSELSVQRSWSSGDVRLALFDERISDALLSQSALLGGFQVAFVQNVDRTRATGVELVAEQRNVLVEGLSLSGWVTYADARTQRDTAFAAAVGKRLPSVPRWRAAMVATYSPSDRLDMTLAARYSDRTFATLDNIDTHANTYQGFGAYFVMDAHVQYRVTPHLRAGLGVDNLGGRSYFLFHPFPQRTVIADLKYSY